MDCKIPDEITLNEMNFQLKLLKRIAFILISILTPKSSVVGNNYVKKMTL